LNQSIDHTSIKIFEDFYQKEFSSDVTSSHWQEVGGHRAALTSEKKIKLSGWGFGSFRENSLKIKVKYIIESILTDFLINKYRAKQSSLSAAKTVAKRNMRYFDFDCVKQALSLDLIESYISIEAIKTVCIIGDGYGFFGSMLKLKYPHIKILSVNLGRTLLFDSYYTNQVSTRFNTTYVTEESTGEADFYFLPAENYHLIEKFNIELFVNIASMQEMNNTVINNYFDLIKRNPASDKYFYCCNRVNKTLPDGEVTKIHHYPWSGFKILHKSTCPWYQKFPIGKPPFWRNFDGQIDHVFAKVEKQLES